MAGNADGLLAAFLAEASGFSRIFLIFAFGVLLYGLIGMLSGAFGASRRWLAHAESG